VIQRSRIGARSATRPRELARVLYVGPYAGTSQYPLCRKVRGGDNQQERLSDSTHFWVRCGRILRDFTPRVPWKRDHDKVRSLWRHRVPGKRLAGKKQSCEASSY